MSVLSQISSVNMKNIDFELLIQPFSLIIVQLQEASSLKFIPYPCHHPSHSLYPRLHSTPLQKGVTFNEQHPPLHCIGGGGKNPLTPPFMGEHKWSEWGKEEGREEGVQC